MTESVPAGDTETFEYTERLPAHYMADPALLARVSGKLGVGLWRTLVYAAGKEPAGQPITVITPSGYVRINGLVRAGGGGT